jgi:hypothetical protein
MADKPGARRAPGEIRDAIIEALQDKPEGATVREIQADVERLLGGSVAASSVRSYLRLGTKATEPYFRRTGHGAYSLARGR